MTKRFIEFATQNTENGEINNGFQDIKTGEWYYTKDSENAKKICDMVNELHKENEQLKQELQKIYEIATVNKVRDIVENVYDDLLYETSEGSDYARTKVLKCLEDIDNLRDDLE